MSLELVYTSAPRGLNAASSGFCTVAATGGISRQVRGKLEGLSGYQFHFDLSDPQANLNPVNFTHTRVRVGADTLSVLSRIAFCGADYSGRTNKIAHHVLLEHGEQMPNGPAWMMMAMARGVFVADWKGDPKHMPKRAIPTVLSDEPRPIEPATTWETMTGDAGWGGALAQAFRKNPKVPAFVIFKPGQELLPLFEESLALLPPEERWQVGFATYYTTLPAGCQYHWRGVLAGSPASREVSRFPNATVVDLTAPLAPAEESLFAEAARTGQVLAPVKAAARPKVRVVDRFRAPVKAGGEPSREPPYARELSSGGPVDEVFAGTSPARGVSSRRRSRLVPALVAAVVLLAASTVVLLFHGPVWTPRQAPSAAPAEPKAPGEPKSGESSESGASEPAEESPVESTVAKTSVSKTPQEGAAAAPAEGDAPSEGATAPRTEKPEPPPQPPEEKGRTPEQEGTKPAPGEEVGKPGAEKSSSQEKPEGEPGALPRLATELVKREELLESHGYRLKRLDPPKPDKDGCLRWNVGRACAFARLAPGLAFGGSALRTDFDPNNPSKMSITLKGQIAGQPLVGCFLAERDSGRELICQISPGARKQYGAQISWLVVEVVDADRHLILACPLGKPPPHRGSSVAVGYAYGGKSISKDSVLLRYPWPQALNLNRPDEGRHDLDVIIETDPGSLRPKLIVSFKSPPDLVEIMRPKWEKWDPVQKRLGEKEKEYERAKKKVETAQAIADNISAKKDPKKRGAAQAKARQGWGALEAFARQKIEPLQQQLESIDPRVKAASQRAGEMQDQLGEKVTEISPLRVCDPWGRTVAEVKVKFLRCEPKDVRRPKQGHKAPRT